jgi:hypothetical protein
LRTAVTIDDKQSDSLPTEFLAITSRISEFSGTQREGSDNARIIARNNARSRQTTSRTVIYCAWESRKIRIRRKKEWRGKVKLSCPEERCSGNYVRYYESKCSYCAKRPTQSCSSNWTERRRLKGLIIFVITFTSLRACIKRELRTILAVEKAHHFDDFCDAIILN